MTIDSNLIKELRSKTGAGILDCKLALNENNGKISESIDWLRRKGLSLAAKKSSRVAAEGLIGISISENCASMIEINSETDFVSRNEVFQDFVRNCSFLSLNVNSDVEELKKMKFVNSENTVQEELTKNIATIGENLRIRRIENLKLINEGLIVSYVHNSVSENLGKIGVLVSFESDEEKDILEKIGKQIAMHIAATKPLAININNLDNKVVENEKKILKEQTLSSGKPEDIAEKIVQGKLKKFLQDVVLEEQIFVIDGKSQIKQVLDDFSKKSGKKIRIVDFKILILGEGIDVDEKDFAAEVAETAKQ